MVVPETATARAKELIGQEDAAVIVHGASWAEANALAQSLSDADTAFVHPFDDSLLWAGHSSMIDEVARTGAYGVPHRLVGTQASWKSPGSGRELTSVRRPPQSP